MRQGPFEAVFTETEEDDWRAPHTLFHSLEDLLKARAESLAHELRTALNDYPRDPDLLILAAVAALLDERPDQALAFHKRLTRYWVPGLPSHLLHTVALAQKGKFYDASVIIKKHNLKLTLRLADLVLPAGDRVRPFFTQWFRKVDQWQKQQASQKTGRRRELPRHRAEPKTTRSQSRDSITEASQPQTAESLESLPRLSADVPFSLIMPDPGAITLPDGSEDPAWFRLRSRFARLNLYQGFDELLCLPQLRDVSSYWYQIETARKVLKNFRGRVLLADEVGLGKTIEAGMILKEYLLRGMAVRVLILTPASMVGQWLEEMETKFDIGFTSTYDGLLRRDAKAFWSQPRVIASIATARRREHFEILSNQLFDIVIVDEAHHLRNRASSNWRLVDALQKRFLLLLSATPVQNSLVELYNLLTLLKPGIFKTEREFRSTYLMPGKPRVPANRDRMRDLMRDVMIRNTRSQVEVRLPPRTAVILRVESLPEEAACYQELNGLIQELHEVGDPHQRLSLRHLLAAAGSSPAAAATSIGRFAESHHVGPGWIALRNRYRSISRSAKEAALVELLQRHANEKQIVFVRNLETLSRVDSLLREQGVAIERFTGSMSGRDKDAAIARFAGETPVLLSTESGGEGRNLQFCNRLINFDLPWNPMAIEQRIGRLHRIGQQRQVFVFNLAVRNTLEDHLIRVLDEKINMFEMVVGEIGAILGEIEDANDFSEMVFSAWLKSDPQKRGAAFDQLAEQVAAAKRQYEGVKTLDEQLFGDEFVAG